MFLLMNFIRIIFAERIPETVFRKFAVEKTQTAFRFLEEQAKYVESDLETAIIQAAEIFT